ncbi:MAG TPA: V-type ATP synthase subunit K [Clostridiales bacterium]|nr:V-type ATP synthase subunit K [Clostridiales bacterium]
MSGQVIAILSLALTAALCGVGSALGLFKTGSAAAGVLSEDPKKFSKVLVLVVLPATQGIYGFVFGIIGLGSVTATMTVAAGLKVLMASLPMMVTGLITAIFQGLTSVACINTIAKQDSLSGKLILFPAMVETYAILGLVVSILLIA